MTRNNVTVFNMRDALSSAVPKPDEPYQLASWAKRYAEVMRGSPLDWARSIHAMWKASKMRPSLTPADADKIGTTLRPDLRVQALAAVARGENELRLRSLIRAHRMLAASREEADVKMAGDIATFLSFAWGIRTAYETISEGDAEAYDKLKAEWGEVQLPPAGATVDLYVADELLIAAAVRRLK